MSADEIRDLLANEYNWDVEEMARDHRMTVHDITGLLQCGGSAGKEEALEKKKTTKASYDVIFTPMVNVEVEVMDPENPTELEFDAIAREAFRKVCENADEKLSAENISVVRLYREPNGRNHFVFGCPDYSHIDPEILLELTHLTYQKLYEMLQNGVEVSHLIRNAARELTEKHKNTDWQETDFWLTMEVEATLFLKTFD